MKDSLKMNGIWITKIGFGATRSGNVKFTKNIIKRIKKRHSLDVLYYAYEETIKKNQSLLRSSFNNVFSIVEPPINNKIRAGEEYLWTINDFVSVELLDWCKSNITSAKYDFAICDYIYMSPVFDAIDHRLVKIINSHDQIGDKHIALDFGIYEKKRNFCVTKGEELNAIDKCDIIMSITRKEQKYFDNYILNYLNGSLGEKHSVLVQYYPLLFKNKKYINKNDSNIVLGFIGSSNIVNEKGINEFLNYFNKLNFKKFKLILAGKICEKVTLNIPNVILMGEVKNELDFYKLIDIIINPMPQGSTGLKIKTIDALNLSLPTIGTKDAFLGLTSKSRWHCFEDIKSMCEGIQKNIRYKKDIQEIFNDSKDVKQRYFETVEFQIEDLYKKIIYFKNIKNKNKKALKIFQNKRNNYDLKIARLNYEYPKIIYEYKKNNTRLENEIKLIKGSYIWKIISFYLRVIKKFKR